MKKLSKEKQLHLAFVGIATLAIIVGLWFFLIGAEQDKIKQISSKSQSVQDQIAKMQKTIVEAGELTNQLHESTNNLGKIESGMPAGDLYSWIVSSVKQFNVPSYKVEMPQFSPPSVTDVRMLPNFPYNQAVVIVSGSAYYYDFGKFLADFENHFPYLRVQNLNLEPGFGSTPDEKEKLSFRMEIITLVKPNA